MSHPYKTEEEVNKKFDEKFENIMPHREQKRVKSFIATQRREDLEGQVERLLNLMGVIQKEYARSLADGENGEANGYAHSLAIVKVEYNHLITLLAQDKK